MKKIFLFISVFWMHQAFAQTEDFRFKSILDKFEQYYNGENYDSIFYSFSSSMQQHMSLDKAQEFFGSLYQQVGKIQKRQLVSAQSHYSTYTIAFERGAFTFDVSLDTEGKISGFLLKPYVADDFPEIARNISPLILPFNGAWTVFWGGDTPDLNYHVESRAQKNAFDFLRVGDDGKTYRTDGKSNEDYYAFDQDIIAPCDGEVVLVVEGIKDNVPGEMNPIYVPGNTVILKSPNHEYLFFAHFKQHSIKVKQGDKVKQGQLLGLCGNSGNSSEPHLHFHVQNVEDMNRATGVKSYFEQILVNGELKADYSPIKGEIVQPVY